MGLGVWMLLLGVQVGGATGVAGSEHVVLVERDVERLETRLRTAAERGFRLLGAVEEHSGLLRSSPIRLHLERAPEDETEARDYRIVSGPYSERLERLVNAVAARGFRVRPDGVLKRTTPNLLGRRDEEVPVLLLEWDANGPPREYRLLSLGTGRQFRREMSRHERDGFRFTGMRGFFDGWLLVVLERPVTEQRIERPPPDAEPRYVLADRLGRKKLFDQVAQLVSRGYRILAAERGGFVGGAGVVLLEKTTTPDRRFAYLSLNETSEPALESRLNEGGAQGYRFHPGLGPPFELIMERAAGDRGVARYRTVAAVDEARIASAVSAARGEGFRFVGMYGGALVLERIDPARGPSPDHQ